MTTTLPTPVRVKEINGDRRSIGSVLGDTFTTHPRDETVHGFRSGADTWREAVEQRMAAWGLDLSAMEGLAKLGVQYVEVRGKFGRYRATMELLLGPKSYVVEYGGHRKQTMLPLHYWTTLPR